MVQGLGALAGLLIARWMSVNDYAIFTVMTMVTGAMTVLTKGGVHLGFTAIVGRTWPDRKRAAQAIAAAMSERRIVSFWILPPIILVTGWLLFKNNASPLLIGVLVLLLILNWEFDMRTRIVDQILYFANRPSTTQILDATLALLRVVGIVGLYFYAKLDPIGATGLAVLAAGLRIPFVVRWVRQEIPKKEVATIKDRAEIKRITRRQLPLEIFNVLQTQIIFAILAWYGSTSQTASIGALWRIGQLLLPVQSVVQAFAIPRFSVSKRQLFRNWLIWSIMGGLPGLGLVALAYFTPSLLLILIGPNYSDLHYELVVAAVGMSANAAINNAWQLIAHRGWNHWAWLQVPIVLIWIVIAPFALDLTLLDQVLWFHAGFPLGLFLAMIVELIAARNRGEFSNRITKDSDN